MVTRRGVLSAGALVFGGGCSSRAVGGGSPSVTSTEISEIDWDELSSGSPTEPDYGIEPALRLDTENRVLTIESAIHVGSGCRTPGIKSVGYAPPGATMRVTVFPEDRPGTQCQGGAGSGAYRAVLGYDGNAPSSVELIEREYDSQEQRFERDL